MAHLNLGKLITQNQERWAKCVVTQSRRHEAATVCARLIRGKALYQQVETDTGVPWFICAVVDERECSCNPADNPAQGDPWNQVSRHVPRGRGPFTSKREAFYDALVKCPPFLAKWKDWSPGGALTATMEYNGEGYELYHHEASPYVWGATNMEEWGKYTADGHWEAHVWDTQLGTAAMLKVLAEMDADVATALGAPPQAPAEPIASQEPLAVPHVVEHDIAWVQASLNKLGFGPLGIDGVAGENTRQVLERYQESAKERGLYEGHIDGRYGPKTEVALEKDLDALERPEAPAEPGQSAVEPSALDDEIPF